MEFKQADQIIHPEIHLDSPIIGNKILYLWRLTGLPTPSNLEHNSSIPIDAWVNIRRRESRLVFKINIIKRHLTQWLHMRGLELTSQHAICHPYSLEWLTTIQLKCISDNFTVIRKALIRARDMTRSGFDQLFSQLSTRLTNTGVLFSRKVGSTVPTCTEGSYLLDNPDLWFDTEWSHACLFWLHIKQAMRNLIRISKSQQDSKSITIINRTEIFVGISPDVCIIVDAETMNYTVLSFECVLMYCDVLEGRVNVAMLCKLSKLLEPLEERVNTLFKLVDNISLSLGDRVYDVISSLEALAYGAIQLYDFDKEERGEFFAFNLREIYQILQESTLKDTSFKLIKGIRIIYSDLSPDQAAELLCVMRLWGHPLLYSNRAAQKVRESMCSPKMVQFDTIIVVLAFFKRAIINGYRRKKGGLWPSVKEWSLLNEELKSAFHDAVELTDAFTLKYYREVAAIQFNKSFEFDIGADLSVYLKDKAICRPKDEWFRVFRPAFDVPKPMNTLAIEQTSNRLLLNFLSRTEFDPQKEFEYVTNMDYLNDREFCASYSLKEKEVKRDGRIFAKMTPKMRSCQVLLEALLSTHVSDLFKENGVSMEQISLTKSLIAMSQLAPRVNMKEDKTARLSDKKINHKTLQPNREYRIKSDTPQQEKVIIAGFLTTDLQKYCLNWRYESIKLFAVALNQLFGIPHGFEWIHLRLRNTTMFVGDPYNPPSSPNGPDLDDQTNEDIFIVSPRGGIEGLCQKMWTMISIALIHAAAAKVGCRVASMVQGDNQVIAITREVHTGERTKESSRELRLLCDEFFSEFKRLNYGLGHNLKAKETIRSQSFFVYSKRVFFEGRILSQILKNASKLNLISDCLAENSISSCSNISSTIARLVENGLSKDVAYILNFLTIVRQLLFDEVYSLSLDYSNTRKLIGTENIPMLVAAALVPGQLGGFNFLNLARLFTRNIGDPVTCSLSDIKWLIRARLLAPHILRNIVLRNPGEGTWSTLVADPYALNIPFVRLPTTYLKRHTQRALISQSTNPLLHGVFIPTQHEEDELLCKFLLDREQVMPRAAHIVFESSALGRRKYLQGLIDTTQTIIRHALNCLPVSYKKSEKIQNYNLLYLTSLYDEVLSPNPSPLPLIDIWNRNLLDFNTCSVTLANFTRICSWSNILNGRQIIGVTTPDTLELCQGSLISCGNICEPCMVGDRSYSWFHLPAGVTFDPREDPIVTQRVPYLGSKTEEHRAASLGHIKGMDHHLKQAIRGASVYIWAYGETEKNWEDAVSLANTRCHVDRMILQTLCPIPSTSNLQHRLADGISTVKFTPASLARVSSYIHICNDKQKHEQLEQSYESNLIYQQIMLLGLGIFETLYPLDVMRVASEQTLHLHTGFSCCVREADVSMVCETQACFPRLTITKWNKFLFSQLPVSEESITQVASAEFRANEANIDAEPTYTLMTMLASFCARALSETLFQDVHASSVKNDAIMIYDNSTNYISEALSVDVTQLAIELGKAILLEMAYQMYYLRVVGKTNIVMYIQTVIKRIPVIQLATLALTISHETIYHRIREKRLVLEPTQPYVSAIDYIKSSREFIVRGVHAYLAMLESGLDSEYNIFDYLEGELSRKVDQLMARRLCILTLLAGNKLNLPLIKGQEPIVKCKLLTDFLQNTSSQGFTNKDIANLALNPKILTYPTNLYYMMRKTLSLIRGREDTTLILTSLYETEFYRSSDLVTLDKDIPVDTFNTPPVLIVEDVIFDKLELHSPIVTDKHELDSLGPPCLSISDPLSKYLYRPIGTASTSWYKTTALLACDVLRTMPLGSSLYLCEGSGSSMASIEDAFPAETIYYNSYFSNEYNPPQRNIGPLPTQFCSSTVYQNLTANIPCSLGFVQQFQVLWNENSDETDVSSTSCVNFICQKVPLNSCHLVHADLDLPIQTPRVVWHSCLTNILIIAANVLKIGGHIVIKLYGSDELLLSLAIGFSWCVFNDIKIIRNGYCNQKSLECYLHGIKKCAIPLVRIQEIQQRLCTFAEKGLSAVPQDVLNKIYTSINSSIEAQRNFSSQSALKWELGSLNSTDMLLLKVGGHSVLDAISDYSSVHDGDVDYYQNTTAQLIDVALTEIIHIKADTTTLDLTLMMSPYNLAIGGKVATILRGLVLQVLIYRIKESSLLKKPSLLTWISCINQGLVSLNSTMPLRLYLQRTRIRKYVLKKISMSELQRFWEYTSARVLSRSEQKLLMRVLGAMWKGL
nr:RNA-dependent RNA polymerase [Avian metaavulavirus 22]